MGISPRSAGEDRLGVSTGSRLGRGESGTSQVQPPTGDTPQPHTTTGAAQFPKNFIVSSGKTLSVSVGALAGRREMWGGAGLCPLQKSNTFIKKAINWYQKKTQGGLQEEAEREAGRQRGTNTVEDRRGGAVQGSWDADTKCMSGPPPTPSEADGQGLCWQVLYR